VAVPSPRVECGTSIHYANGKANHGQKQSSPDLQTIEPVHIDNLFSMFCHDRNPFAKKF
jgi:hypothetical protein